MRQKKQMLHDYAKLKKEYNDLNMKIIHMSSMLRQVSGQLKERKKCHCGGKLTWLFDDDGFVMGEKCLRCGKAWYL